MAVSIMLYFNNNFSGYLYTTYCILFADLWKMSRRICAKAALEKILEGLESEEETDTESEYSVSDCDYEVEQSTDSSSDESDNVLYRLPSPVVSISNRSMSDNDEIMQNDDMPEDEDTVGLARDGISEALAPEVNQHIEDCINAVVAEYGEMFVASDGTVWSGKEIPTGRRKAVNVMRSAGGLSALGRRTCTENPLTNWKVIVTDEILDTIVECTNDKARIDNNSLVITRQDLETFIGVSILIGVYKGRGEPIRAVWSESEGRKCISQFMSRPMFEKITKYIRFDLSNTRQTRRQVTKFAPMGYVFDMWEQQLSKPFIPYEYVTVDETLVPFRGRCSFKQYMPSKPAKYGLKFWCLCDAQTGYCLRMMPYLGADVGSVRQTGLGERVVLDLTRGLDVGRTVVTDNFFTSFALTRELRNRNLGHIGTVRKNRRELPREFTEKKSEAGSSLFGFNEDATLVSFAPKKNKRVVLISSEHSNADIDVTTGKPQIILAYNKSKGGVDHLDQMCGAYTTRKRTNRWPKCVFQHMVDVTAFNSFVLWSEATNTHGSKRRQFLKMLGAALCGGEVDECGNIRMKKKDIQHTGNAGAMGSRLRCRICKNNKTVQRCHACEDPLCISCATYHCPNC